MFLSVDWLERFGNLFECWFWIAIGLCFAVSLSWQKDRPAKLLAACNFVAFGLSDFVESGTGAWWRPWWLLVWKAACVAVMAGQLIQYEKRRRRAKAG